MHEAAQALIGEHDFSAFRSIECQSNTPIRRVDSIHVERHGDHLYLDFTANAYLHHMVRNIVGTLIEAQSDSAPAARMAAILAGRDRRRAGYTAPPSGLYLSRVIYPPVFGIPSAPVELLLK
jgi:tRNA pseudouridine38-40 synthase